MVAVRWMSRPLFLIAIAVFVINPALDFCSPSRGRVTLRGSPHVVADSQISMGPGLGGRAPLARSSGATPSTAMGVALLGALAAAIARRSGRTSKGSLLARRALTSEEDLSIDKLLAKYASDIKAIRRSCDGILGDRDDTYVLRFAIEHDGDVAKAVKNVEEVMAWRAGEGKKTIEDAAAAVAKAKAGGAWDNTPVFEAAPHSAKLGKYLTASQIIVVSMPNGDLCSCIRASAIDDSNMMNEVSSEELIDFFIYCREVNFLVAEERTRKTGTLVKLLAANDLSNVSKFPDDRFQKALTGSSKKATTLYPGFAGQTLILNLPGIVRLLVSFLTPLFPGAVQSRIKFAKGPMSYLKDLAAATTDPNIKKMFIEDLDVVLSS